MSKINCKIWDRDFSLDIVYDVYKGESISEKQNEALDVFQKNASALLNDPSEICKYCLKQNKADIPTKEIDNIFKYVIPQKIFICRSEKRKVALLCAYKFDPEHGLALVYENEKLITIDKQDIVF